MTFKGTRSVVCTHMPSIILFFFFFFCFLNECGGFYGTKFTCRTELPIGNRSKIVTSEGTSVTYL